MHLLIPYAACSAPESRALLATLPLPHVKQLLARLQAAPCPPGAAAGSASSLSAPHEVALAQRLGLPAADGQIAWAAHHARAQVEPARAAAPADSQAWAFITPCHWQVGTDQITLADPAALALSADDLLALHAALQPYFAEDGIELLAEPVTLASGAAWLARSAVFGGLATASLDRVIGRSINAWMTEGVQAAPLRRLQNEMQMLLYTHPLNDARSQRNLPPVNSFWVHGTGALDPLAAVATAAPEVVVASALRTPALQGDWSAWGQAWQEIDRSHGAALLAALRQSADSAASANSLTLCGELSSQGFEPAQNRLKAYFSSLFYRLPIQNLPV
ncbi:MAG: phosphoglycerate mutase [Burkholderiaceae bacterium]